jgi:hypothetical protein
MKDSETNGNEHSRICSERLRECYFYLLVSFPEFFHVCSYNPTPL